MPHLVRALVIGLLASTAAAASPAGPEPEPELFERPPIGRTFARISLVTAQAETMKRFYVDVLGFEAIFEGPVGDEGNAEAIARAWHLEPGARLHGIVLRSPRDRIMIQISHVVGQQLEHVPRRHDAAPLAGDHYFTIHVPDLDAAVRRMAAFGTPFHRGPHVVRSLDRKGNAYSVYEAAISDPDGTTLILVDDRKAEDR